MRLILWISEARRLTTPLLYLIAEGEMMPDLTHPEKAELDWFIERMEIREAEVKAWDGWCMSLAEIADDEQRMLERERENDALIRKIVADATDRQGRMKAVKIAVEIWLALIAGIVVILWRAWRVFHGR